MSVLDENPVDVVRAVLEADRLNPINEFEVRQDVVLDYLTEWPLSVLRVPLTIPQRVHHFKQWLDGRVTIGGQYYTKDGMFCNADGTRNIFDDVDQ